MRSTCWRASGRRVKRAGVERTDALPAGADVFRLADPQTQHGDTMTLCIPFRRAPDTALHLTRDDVRLDCVPVVNLFTRTSEPLPVGHTHSEYRLVADLYDKEMQIYRIAQLWMSRRDEARQCHPITVRNMIRHEINST